MSGAFLSFDQIDGRRGGCNRPDSVKGRSRDCCDEVKLLAIADEWVFDEAGMRISGDEAFEAFQVQVRT